MCKFCSPRSLPETKERIVGSAGRHLAALGRGVGVTAAHSLELGEWFSSRSSRSSLEMATGGEQPFIPSLGNMWKSQVRVAARALE